MYPMFHWGICCWCACPQLACPIGIRSGLWLLSVRARNNVVTRAYLLRCRGEIGAVHARDRQLGMLSMRPGAFRKHIRPGPMRGVRPWQLCGWWWHDQLRSLWDRVTVWVSCPRVADSNSFWGTARFACPHAGAAVAESCPLGNHAPSQGMAACEACNTGTRGYTGTDGSASCIPCERGYYQNLAGQSACVACSAGSFGAYTGHANCELCALGKYSGAIGSQDDGCRLCAAGEYADTRGGASCKDCAKGSYQDKTGQSYCTTCHPGSYVDGVKSTENCTPCSVGRYQPNYGSEVECTECDPGKSQTNRGQSICFDCDLGKYSPTPGQVACFPATEGSVPNAAKTGTELCLAGTYANGTGNSQCTPCPIGSIIDVGGSAFCDVCEVGRYQDETGQSVCKDCVAGKYADSQGRSKCAMCPLGRYEGAADGTGCEIVPAGYIANDGGTGLKACGVGSYSDVAGLTACKDLHFSIRGGHLRAVFTRLCGTELRAIDLRCVPTGELLQWYRQRQLHIVQSWVLQSGDRS
jgi:hypothetical protein